MTPAAGGKEYAHVRVLAFTDQPFLSEGFRVTLAEAGFAASALCGGPEELLPAVARYTPDVAVLDVSPLDLGAVLNIRKRLPACRIVLWTDRCLSDLVHQAIEAGVSAIVPRTAPPHVLIETVRRVSSGEMQFHIPGSCAWPMRIRLATLSPRERRLLALICEGLKNKEIAAAIGATEGTVKTYLSRLFKRAGVVDRFELALYGMQTEAAYRAIDSMATSAARPPLPARPELPALQDETECEWKNASASAWISR